MKKIGFDTDKYLNEQSKKIHERVAKFEKLYLGNCKNRFVEKTW